MDIQEEMKAFERHLTDTGLVEFAGYGFELNECDEYLHEPTLVAWECWLIGSRRAKAQAVPEGFVLVKKRNLIGNPNVDFLQAPRWAKYWLMDGHSKKYWWSSVRPKKDMDLLCYVWGGKHFVGEAPSFGFAGPWNESLTSKKAMLEAQEPAND